MMRSNAIQDNEVNLHAKFKGDIFETRRKLASLGRYINETGDKNHNQNLGSNLLEAHQVTGSVSNIKCDSRERLVFASSDAHDGPRTDISFVLLSMNQTFLHIGPRNATKNYPQGLPLTFN